MVEGARLESVYTSKGYRGFESLSLRLHLLIIHSAGFFMGYTILVQVNAKIVSTIAVIFRQFCLEMK